MNAATFSPAITRLLAALFLSVTPAFGNPIVKYVPPSGSRTEGRAAKVQSSEAVDAPSRRVSSTQSARRRRQITSRAVSERPPLRKKLIRQPVVGLIPVPELNGQQRDASNAASATTVRSTALSKFIGTRSKPKRDAKHVERPKPSGVNEKAKSSRLSAFIQTNRDEQVAAEEAESRKATATAPTVTVETRNSSPLTASAVVKTPPKETAQPKHSVDAKPTNSHNLLRDGARNSLPPLRQTQPAEPETPPIPLPPHLDARSKAAEPLGDSIAKTRIQYVAAPNVRLQNASSRVQSALLPEPVNSELVRRITGQHSLIAFVSTEPAVEERGNDVVRTAGNETAEDDEYEDGLTAIDRLTVNVRPSEGELPPDHASAKFANEGEVVQRMGASRHWMMYEFNWEASALVSRPLYFEDVNLERYGYSYGLLLGPAVSAGQFFLRIPFIPYMRGADPPLQPVYTLGYGRPGTYFPYHLHRPPLSLRGAVQEAAWAVGLYYILP